MCATYPIKGDATKVRLNFRGLKIGDKAKFEQKQPYFWMEKDVNDFPGRYIKVAQDLDLREVQL